MVQLPPSWELSRDGSVASYEVVVRIEDDYKELVVFADNPARALTDGIAMALSDSPPGTEHQGAWCYL